VALSVSVEGESCAVLFLGGHFLFTSLDTFAAECIVQPPLTPTLKATMHSITDRQTDARTHGQTTVWCQ